MLSVRTRDHQNNAVAGSAPSAVSDPDPDFQTCTLRRCQTGRLQYDARLLSLHPEHGFSSAPKGPKRSADLCASGPAKQTMTLCNRA